VTGRHLAVAAAATLAALFGVRPAFASMSMSRVVHGHPLTYAATLHAGYGGAVAYGAPVRRVALAEFGPPNPQSVSCAGQTCFSLGTIDGFEYPLISMDEGTSWRNAGHWFAGAWSDGAAFASTMSAFSATTAVAWFPGQNTFYVTSDAGHRWYAAWPDGDISAVTSPNGGNTLVMYVSPYSTKPMKIAVVYRSTDGGRQWIRTS
jgi:hypothetical protein